MKNDIQCRKWQLTINNPLEKGLSHEKIKEQLANLSSISYYCLADEIGLENRTPHTHIFIFSKSPIRFSTVKKQFPEAHIEKATGSVQENIDYINKEGKWKDDPKKDTSVVGTFEEWGEIPEEPGQGTRTDLILLYNLILMGKTNAEIIAQNPDLIVHLTKFDKLRADMLQDQYRDKFRSLDVVYVWGPTGTGKTRMVLEEHGYLNVYRTTDYNHPFDHYNSEPVICFDEFRSSLPISDMLNYLDGYPLALPARYANRIACYEKVYIISNIDLKDQYRYIQEEQSETFKAFLRRIHHVIEFHKDSTPTDHGNAMDYIFPPPPPVPDWVKEAENAKQVDLLI